MSLSHTNNRLQRLAGIVLLVATLFAVFPATALAEDHPGVVNVNEATKAELQQLPRIGPALAQRILDYREENGEFNATEDLILVRGIGERTYEMLSHFVVIEGETTLSRKLRTADVPSEDDDAGSGES